TGLPLPINRHGSAQDAISIRVHEGGAPAGHEREGYQLSVSSSAVGLEAATREGALNGVRTLQQLFGAWATSSHPAAAPRLRAPARSEERRVGKESRSRWPAAREMK